MNNRTITEYLTGPEGSEWMSRIYREEDIPAQKERYKQIFERFSQWSGSEKFLPVRSPGRINLIGEHTDYNHCPVFPMAVDRDIIGFFSPRNDRKVRIADFNPAFGERDFFLSRQIQPHPGGDWANYIKAAVQGLIEETVVPAEEAVGFNLMFHSQIPPAAGMSSSSALVVLTALVFLHVNNRRMDKKDLADLLARAERYTGTQGGGMDQAAILLGEAGKAVKIDFAPLKTASFPLPERFEILVAHSTVEAPKTREVMDKYNRRSIECRLAAALISRFLEEKGQPAINFLGDLSGSWYESGKGAKTKLQEVLKTDGYSKEELCRILKVNEKELNRKWCYRKDGTDFPEPEEGFLLYKRAFHVLTEWNRVEDSKNALLENRITDFGRLMNESHGSCRDNHEISCPELDKLITIGNENGAEGCRLTGAGFGGCSVHLVNKDKGETYRKALLEEYYNKYLNYPEGGKMLFSVKPSDGAAILEELINE